MLKILRKKGVAKKILWMISFFIILSFVLWGQSSTLQDKSARNYAGKIFGRKISPEQYQHSLEMARMQAMMQYGQEFAKVSQFLNLQAQAWDRLVLLHEADRRRIKVSNAEVIQAIGAYPLFQRDGKIDSLRYNDLLRYVFHIRPRDFEEGIRDNLKIAKMIGEETAGLNISEDEAFKTFKQEREKIQVSYVLFADDSYKNQVPLDEEKIKEYYKNNLDAFTLPLMINVEYVRFDVPSIEKQTKKDAEDKPDAKTPEAEPPAQDVEQKTATYKKALSFLDEARQTKNFDQTAKKNNLPIQESGLFSMEQPNLKSGWSFPVVQKIFNLQENDLNGPVETPEGYQVLKIKEKKASYTLAYEDAKDKVKEAWLKAEARKIAKQKAEEYLPKIREQYQAVKKPDFAKIAKDLGLDIEQTPVFGRGQYLPKIGISRDFQDRAFGLAKNAVSNAVITTAKGFCILHLDSKTPVTKEDFAKEKDKVMADVLEQKKTTAVNDFLTRLRLKSGLEDHVAELMKQ